MSRRGIVVLAAIPALLLLGPADSGQSQRPGRLEHFKCYDIQKSVPRNFNARNVKLSDQFAADEATRVIDRRELCSPVRKNREPYHNKSAHLHCYAIRPLIPPQPPGAVEVDNQFGTARFDVGRPVRLCNPASRGTIEDPPPPVSQIDFTDHFKCYRVTPQGQFRPRRVRLGSEDETRPFRVLRPVLLCNPVQKDAEPVRNPRAHLVCYEIDPADGEGEGPAYVARVRDQFGLQRMRIRERRSLCVPSRKRRI